MFLSVAFLLKTCFKCSSRVQRIKHTSQAACYIVKLGCCRNIVIRFIEIDKSFAASFLAAHQMQMTLEVVIVVALCLWDYCLAPG